LLFSGLGCAVDEDAGFFAVEAEADDGSLAAAVGFVDGVFLVEAIGGGCGGGGVHGMVVFAGMI